MYSNQRDDCFETNAGNGQTSAQGGATGHNNKGRVDYPLTPEAAKKLRRGSAHGEINFVQMVQGFQMQLSIYSANSGYEYLATEIYGYAYEQGIDRVYIKGFEKDRIALTELLSKLAGVL